MILLIDNYDSFTFNLYQLLSFKTRNVKVTRNDKITIGQIKALGPQGIVLSPGPGRPEDAGICIEVIKKLGCQIPILGVCLGHQAIAAAFGAEVISASNIVHGKKANVFHCQRQLFQNMPLPFEAGRYHSLAVAESTLPESLLVEAVSSDGVVMGIRHRNFPIYGVQFHPESILTPQGNRLIENFLSITEGKYNDNDSSLAKAC